MHRPSDFGGKVVFSLTRHVQDTHIHAHMLALCYAVPFDGDNPYRWLYL